MRISPRPVSQPTVAPLRPNTELKLFQKLSDDLSHARRLPGRPNKDLIPVFEDPIGAPGRRPGPEGSRLNVGHIIYRPKGKPGLLYIEKRGKSIDWFVINEQRARNLFKVK